MKKIFLSIIALLIITNTIFATTTIKGDFSLSELVNIDDSFNTTNFSFANLNLFLNSSSNNVKYTVKGTVNYYYDIITNPSQPKYNTSFEISQAYLKFRIPFNNNYLTFNFGKTPLDIGGDWQFNSGTPFDTTYSTSLLTNTSDNNNPWIASAKTRLFDLKDFKSLNLELLFKFPFEDSDTKAGARITYDVNSASFGTFETSFLTDNSETILAGGFNGTLFFDYGLYAKNDLQDLNNFEASFYLLKIFSDYTFKFEGLYENEIDTYTILPSISYAINAKNSISFMAITIYNETTDWMLSPVISFTQNIVQGLDFNFVYSYSKATKNSLAFNITHKF
jgi:hypothetical protein